MNTDINEFGEDESTFYPEIDETDFEKEEIDNIMAQENYDYEKACR